MIDFFGKKAKKRIKELEKELDNNFWYIEDLKSKNERYQEEIGGLRAKANKKNYEILLSERTKELERANISKIQEISSKFIVQKNCLVEKLNFAISVLEKYSHKKNGKDALLALENLKKQSSTIRYKIVPCKYGFGYDLEEKKNG